jgi:hypothetical protein
LEEGEKRCFDTKLIKIKVAAIQIFKFQQTIQISSFSFQKIIAIPKTSGA